MTEHRRTHALALCCVLLCVWWLVLVFTCTNKPHRLAYRHPTTYTLCRIYWGRNCVVFDKFYYGHYRRISPIALLFIDFTSGLNWKFSVGDVKEQSKWSGLCFVDVYSRLALTILMNKIRPRFALIHSRSEFFVFVITLEMPLSIL